MSQQRIEIRGEFFVTLETAAEWYHVSTSWIEELYSSGLLGEGERVGDSVAVQVTELDHLAAILRWHHYGLDLEAATALFGR